MKYKSTILDEAAMMRTLVRIAHEIIERNETTDNLCLVGIKTRGVPIAEMLAEKIKSIGGNDIPVGTLDITFYRDDLSERADSPTIADTDIPFDITDKNTVLVDDVIFTGRTVRAAMDALINRGRPATVQLAVLVDRGHRELPIRPDFVGKNIPTSKSEVVAVNLNSIDGKCSIELYER